MAIVSAVGITLAGSTTAFGLCDLSGTWSSGWPASYAGEAGVAPTASKALFVSNATTPFGIPHAQYMVQPQNQALALHPDMQTCFGNGTCPEDKFGNARDLNDSTPSCTFIQWPDSDLRHTGGSWCKSPFCAVPPPPPPPTPPFPPFNLTWKPTYNMRLSTVSNPNGNQSGLDQGALLQRDAQYGIIVFDGADMGCLHERVGPPDDPCRYAKSFQDAETLARSIKAISPDTHILTYMNMELMLSRNEFDCPIMHNPAYRGYFLTNHTDQNPVHKPSVNKSKDCSAIAPPSDYANLTLYFLDWTNESAVDWWLNTKIQSIIDSPVLDGFYWDDPTFGNEAEWIRDWFPPKKLAAIDKAMFEARLEARLRLAKVGGFCMGCAEALPPPMSCIFTGSHTNSSCDTSATTVLNNLKSAAAKNDSASIMPVTFPEPGLDINVTCNGPTIVQKVPTNPTLLPQVMQLSCLPGTGTMSVDFASFGLPIVGSNVSAPDCAVFAVNSTCDAGPDVLQRLKLLCDGKQSCRFNTSDPIFAPPTNSSDSRCQAQSKDWTLAVKASGCEHGTGGGQRAWFRETLAAFLLTRGPQSWMGHGWIGFAQPTWYPEWSIDYGEPIAPIEFNNTNTGMVAFREWSKMRVELDVGGDFEARFYARG